MTESDTTLVLPKTVHAFLSNPAIQTAVDSLEGVSRKKLPADLEFHELEDYYAARAAAELTIYDWAGMLRELWTKIWANSVAASWQAASLAELLAKEYPVTPDACWDDDWFGMYYYRSDQILYTGVQIHERTIDIAFSLEGVRSKPKIKEAFNGFAWQSGGDDEDWDDWMVQTFPFSRAEAILDLGQMTTAARSALALVESFS